MPGVAALHAKEDEEGGGELVEAQDIKLMLPLRWSLFVTTDI